ncbi:DinB family protein [Polaribacter aestuariivivens]|uniref:DinB family protein n=1 Tax=Polaribacter aestuariivivens TaxID=2304626 RepID=UPI003F492919
MIEAIEQNLQKGIKLLNTLTDEQYSNNSIAPYYSSIGCHMRHALDMFSCIFKGLETGEVNLTKRDRNELAEKYTNVGVEYFFTTISKLKSLTETELNKQLLVTDDLGLGTVTVKKSLAAILMQAQSHTTHHYATVGYLIYNLKIELPESNFGFNPTTPKRVSI